MTATEFEAKYPLILNWIEHTLAWHAGKATSVGLLEYQRLPQYFSREVLERAKVVYVESVPKPPLRALGLAQFVAFEDMDANGITYLDTFFARNEMRGDVRLHFHELVHVLQWQILGPKLFLAAYGDGLERFGYRDSPLERMAYDLDQRFQSDT